MKPTRIINCGNQNCGNQGMPVIQKLGLFWVFLFSHVTFQLVPMTFLHLNIQHMYASKVETYNKVVSYKPTIHIISKVRIQYSSNNNYPKTNYSSSYEKRCKAPRYGMRRKQGENWFTKNLHTIILCVCGYVEPKSL